MDIWTQFVSDTIIPALELDGKETVTWCSFCSTYVSMIFFVFQP